MISLVSFAASQRRLVSVQDRLVSVQDEGSQHPNERGGGSPAQIDGPFTSPFGGHRHDTKVNEAAIPTRCLSCDRRAIGRYRVDELATTMESRWG